MSRRIAKSDSHCAHQASTSNGPARPLPRRPRLTLTTPHATAAVPLPYRNSYTKPPTKRALACPKIPANPPTTQGQQHARRT